MVSTAPPRSAAGRWVAECADIDLAGGPYGLAVAGADQRRWLGTNWVDVTGSTITNQMAIPMDGNNGSVFYRLLLQ